MDKLSALASFVHAVDLGSFSAAASHLGVSQPAVSHQVRALEKNLGTRLLNRTTRRLALTEAGERYYTYARDILETISEADSSVRSLDEQMKGRLAIGTSVGFTEAVLAEFLLDFKRRYPSLLLDLSLTEHFADVVAERLDLVIRMGEIHDERLVVRKLGDAERRLAASPSYLDQMGRPAHPEELRNHQYLLYSQITTGDKVSLTSQNGETVTVRIQPSLCCNNSTLLRQAGIAGLGIGLYHKWLLDPLIAEGKLEQVLPDWRYPSHPIHAVYPSNRYIPLKVRRFVDELAALFERKGAFSGNGN